MTTLFDARENSGTRTNGYGLANTHDIADDTFGQQNNEVAKFGYLHPKLHAARTVIHQAHEIYPCSTRAVHTSFTQCVTDAFCPIVLPPCHGSPLMGQTRHFQQVCTATKKTARDLVFGVP